jgi:N-carbamoyl-L-amino-acid hydrolase
VRYVPDMMGSLVYAGGLSVDEALATVGTDGTVLGMELERIGYMGSEEPGFLKPHAYVELHIEQRPVLEREGVPIGAVENLQGISWQRVTIEGEANHGGTPGAGCHWPSHAAGRYSRLRAAALPDEGRSRHYRGCHEKGREFCHGYSLIDLCRAALGPLSSSGPARTL